MREVWGEVCFRFRRQGLKCCRPELRCANGARGRECPPDGQRVRRYRYCFQNCSDQKEQVVCGTTVSQVSPQSLGRSKSSSWQPCFVNSRHGRCGHSKRFAGLHFNGTECPPPSGAFPGEVGMRVLADRWNPDRRHRCGHWV